MATDQIVSFSYEGLAQLNDFFLTNVKLRNVVKLTWIDLYAQGAPTGADLHVTLTKNGIDTPAVAVLPDGSKSNPTNIADQTFDTTDGIGFKITQIGSTFPGEGLKVVLHYEKVS